jgi:hypothetical protein
LKSDVEDMLNYIIDKKGDCLDSEHCVKCPFLSDCTKSMLRDWKNPPINARAKRVNRALELITDQLLMGAGIE